GPITLRVMRWLGRWTRSASTARSSSLPFPCIATTRVMRWKCNGHPDRFAIVKPVDPDDPAVGDIIADWKQTPGAVGSRIMMTKEEPRGAMGAGVARVLRGAEKHDFRLNILGGGNVEAGTMLIAPPPDPLFITALLAILRPPPPRAPPQPWADLP